MILLYKKKYMKKFIVNLLAVFLLLSTASVTHAVYDPKGVPNNASGIHILFPTELERAAQIVNTTGGDWGYVTIPIQVGNRDMELWQTFMDTAAKYRLIPIVRLATEPYYDNTGVWRKPTYADVQDFANFLNSLQWPTKNRYVILFNEVNRFDEWQGEAPDPEEYADIASYAIEVFKRKNSDFFLITAGLDNASPNDGVKYLDNLVYLRMMGSHNPEVFEKIDGISSHSYPNPGFSQPPSTTRIEGTSTYKYENDLVKDYAGETKPVFLTETGWDANAIGEEKTAQYLKESTATWFSDTDIIAVTPFLLESAGGPFDKFTFMKNGTLTKYAKAYQEFPKKKGQPPINKMTDVKNSHEVELEPIKFGYASFSPVGFGYESPLLKSYFKTILGMIQ